MNNKFSSNRKGKLFFMIPCIIVLALLFVWGVQLLWNALIPEIFGIQAISFWQAFGILLLSKILFGGFRFKSRSHCNKHDLNACCQYFADDDSSKFKAEWKRRFASVCQDRRSVDNKDDNQV